MSEKPKKQIKLTVTEKMFNSLKERANKMSLSVPALYCYYIGEKLYQNDFVENSSFDAVKQIIENFIDDEENKKK